ncbi:alkaline phosphatase, tissue-nonspecific isozyme isoform X2 [Aricia agestis]|nr:alkaline phosphatase, tissue-nonspecific isozyme isoform X2 [Aricia agestis]
MVPDSACTSTALLCGVKTNQHTVGVDATVDHYDCDASLEDKAKLDSLAALALRAGKSAGFVTTMRVTHATPAPMYAHSAARQWECDAAMPRDTKCKDHARQLVEDWPGRDLQVILGGGRQGFVPNATGTPSDPISSWGCSRQDGRDLIQKYKYDKQARGQKYKVVENYGELSSVDYDETDYLLGIFSNAHLQYEHEKSLSADGMPTIVNMTEAAIRVLRKNPNGFFLMVEGGNIDMAHHRGRARTAVSEAGAMDDAVAAALRLVDHHTLVVVTADHTHTLTINGYPDRGADVFGVIGPSPYDHKNYTTLAYGTGGPGSVHYAVDNGTAVRTDPSGQDTASYTYEQIAAVPLDENSHGGGDVVIYAKGPFAHLFHSVHEQHYVHHAIKYAARMGEHAHSHAGYVQPSVAMLLAILAVSYL